MHRLWLLPLLTGLAAAPAHRERPGSPPASPAARRLAQATNRFGLRLFHELLADSAAAAISLSPFSAAIALDLAWNGAAVGARDALAQTLSLDGLPADSINAAARELLRRLPSLDTRVRITIGNSIWYRADRRPQSGFLALASRFYHTHVEALDFRAPTAPRRINAWAAHATRGLVPRAVPDHLPPDAAAYLVNAIHFSGAWTVAFDRSRTRDHPFRNADGSVTGVRMMSPRDTVSVGFLEERGLSVVDIPYGRGAFSLLVAFPADPATIRTLAANLTPERFEHWTSRLVPTLAHLSLPRFSLTDDRTLLRPLAALGMGPVICPLEADFSPMFAGGRYCISDVRHSTVLRVNEAGTVAAAVTTVAVSVTRAILAPREIVVDRPFVYAIRERGSGVILFLGLVTSPVA